MAEKDVPTILDEAGVEYELLAHAHTETAAAEAEARSRSERRREDARPRHAGRLCAGSPTGFGSSRPAQVREHVEGGKRIHLASEEDAKQDYSGFELGAVPPFGGSSDRVLVDSRLAERESVVLEAGSHEQSVRIRTADLLELTRAEVVDLAQD